MSAAAAPTAATPIVVSKRYDIHLTPQLGQWGNAMVHREPLEIQIIDEGESKKTRFLWVAPFALEYNGESGVLQFRGYASSDREVLSQAMKVWKRSRLCKPDHDFTEQVQEVCGVANQTVESLPHLEPAA